MNISVATAGRSPHASCENVSSPCIAPHAVRDVKLAVPDEMESVYDSSTSCCKMQERSETEIVKESRGLERVRLTNGAAIG